MKEESIASLDIGNSKVTGAFAVLDGERRARVRSLVSVPSRGIQRGVVTDLEEAAVCVQTAIRELERHASREFASLVLSVGGMHVEGVQTQGFKPIIPRTRLITHQDVLEVVNHSRSVVLSPEREQIQAIPREFRIDGERGIQRPVGMSGGKLEVITYIVSGQTTHLQNLERVVERAGRHVEQMVLSPLAGGLGVLSNDELRVGTAYIDMGAGLTSLAVFLGGSLAYTAFVPIGSQAVTSDLSKLLRTSPEEAERLKIQHGSAIARVVPEEDSISVRQIGQDVERPMQRRVLCEIIESRMREIAMMCRAHLEKSGCAGSLAGLVISGGGAKMSATSALFEEVCRFPVRSAEPALNLAVLPKFGVSVAVGLAQYALAVYDELSPVQEGSSWKDKVRSLWSLLSGK